MSTEYLNICEFSGSLSKKTRIDINNTTARKRVYAFASDDPSEILLKQFSPKTTHIRIVSTYDLWVRIVNNEVNKISNQLFVPANEPTYLLVWNSKIDVERMTYSTQYYQTTPNSFWSDLNTWDDSASW